MQSKVIFGVICVEVSRKFSKNPHFLQKSISTNFKIFESISTEVGSPPKYLCFIFDHKPQSKLALATENRS